MAELTVGPINIINLIADNLRDRYRSRFSVLKELIQNADDAPSASGIAFVITQGLPDADNPLLKTPALVAVNNGILREQDADGILQFAVSHKAHDDTAIGKFGLGQKAVFHLCETFMYIYEDPEAAEESRNRSEVINPWTNVPNRQELSSRWNALSSSDDKAMRKLVKRSVRKVFNGDRYLAFWIPLRCREHLLDGDRELSPIVKEFHTPDALEEEMSQSHRLAALLPLLRQIRDIECVRHTRNSNGESIESLLRVRLEGDAIQLPKRSVDDTDTTLVMRGQAPIRIRGLKREVRYAGLERTLLTKFLKQAKDSKAWPRIQGIGLDGEELDKPESAIPQGAVALVRQPKANDEAKLIVEEAVFLPLGERHYDVSSLESGISGSDVSSRFDYHLLLHGYYFVDAGRQAIEGTNEPYHADGVSLSDLASRKDGLDEVAVRRFWNVALRDEVVLPLIPKALRGAIDSIEMSRDEVSALCSAIRQTKLFRDHARAINNRHSLVLSVIGDHLSWEFATTDDRVLQVPETTGKGVSLLPELFPNLEKWQKRSGENVILLSPVSAPNLRIAAPHDHWGMEEVKGLLATASADLFESKRLVSVLADFLEIVGSNNGVTDGINPELLRLLKEALAGKPGPREVTANASDVRRVLTHIRRERILFLPKESSRPEVISALARVETRSIVLPESLATDEGGGAVLSIDEVYGLIQPLDALIAGSDPKIAEAASLAAASILRACEASLDQLLKDGRVAKLKVLRARDESVGETAPISFDQLAQALEEGRLFLAAPGKEARELARALQGVIEKPVLLLDQRIAALLPSLKAEGISASSCLVAVFRSHSLSNADKRANLVRVTSSVEPSSHISELRYLCTGDRRATESEERLLRAVGLGVDHVATQLLEAQGVGWQLVPKVIADCLTARHLDVIGVAPIDGSSVSALLDQAAPEMVKGLELGDAEREALLALIEDPDIWRRLPLHRRTDDSKGPVESGCFLENNYPPGDSLLPLISLIVVAENQKVSQQQSIWLERWGPEGCLRTALDTTNPSEHADAILAASLDMRGDLKAPLLDRLRSRPWLQTPFGKRSPVQVVDVGAYLAEGMMAVLAKVPSFAVLPANCLSDEITRPIAEAGLRDRLFLSGGDALRVIGSALGEQPKIYITSEHMLVSFPIREAQSLAIQELELPALVGWKLLAPALRGHERIEEVEEHILPALGGVLDTDTLMAVLQSLGQFGERSDLEPVREMLKHYLRVALRDPDRDKILSSIKLPSRSGTWRSGNEIALKGEDVEGTFLVAKDFADLFGDAPVAAKSVRVPDDKPRGGPNDDDVGETADKLRAYFEGWRNRVPLAPIGAFVGLLGSDPRVQDLAEDLLSEGGFDPDTLWSGIGELKGRASFAHTPFQEVFERQRFAIRFVEEGEVELASVAGTPFRATLETSAKGILAGQLSRSVSLSSGKQACWLTLRRLDPSTRERIHLLDSVRRAFDLLLLETYGLTTVGLSQFDDLWGRIADSGQLGIEAAQDMVKDDLGSLLKTIGISSSSKLQRASRAVDQARRAKIQAKGTPEELANAEKAFAKAKEEMIRQLVGNDDAKRELVSAVRRKIEDYEYSATRVPFELFQNADDAAVQAGSHDSSGQAQRVWIEATPECLLFAHWGRSINDLGPDREVGHERGYEGDLEKLLIMGFSDKGEEDDTTGRFGLGFKSVYLITDEPFVISGWLSFRIVGGLYPEAFEDEEDLVDRVGMDGTRPTIFGLPARPDGISPVDAITELLESAGPLSVFGKRIHKIQCEMPEGSITSSWEGLPLIGLDNVFLGQLALWDDEKGIAHHRAISIEVGQFKLLLCVDPTGFNNILARFPSVWTLAPTDERWETGYIMDGPFRVDVGRLRLAGQKDRNLEQFEDFGRLLGETLVQLYDAAEDRWDDLVEALGLEFDEGSTTYRFWMSLFMILTAGLVHDGRVFLRELHGDGRGLSGLLRRRKAIPSGLKGALAHLVQADDDLWFVEGSLAQPLVMEAMIGWQSMKIRERCLISKEIADRCERLGISGARRLDLAMLMREEMGDRREVTPKVASRLGELLSIEWVNGEQIESTEERAAILKATSEGRFKAKDGSWRRVRNLHAAGTGDEDEELRLAFAPPSAVLSLDYDVAAIHFFELCRLQSGFGGKALLDNLAKWATEAKSSESQAAALRYIVDGTHGPKVAVLLRAYQPAWIPDSGALLASNLLDNFSDEQQKLLMVQLFPESIIVVPGESQQEIKPEEVLLCIGEWWSDRRDELAESYDRQLYPLWFDHQSLVSEDDEERRIGWFTMLAIACFLSLGRTRDGQHRSFIDSAFRDGWWERLALSAPPEDLEAWQDRLETIASPRNEDQVFHQWHRCLVDLYLFVRGIEAYEKIFRSLPQRLRERKGRVQLSQMLKPSFDPALTGSGIEAPTVQRSIGIGVCWIIREMVRKEVLSGDDALSLSPYCWMPTSRVRRILQRYLGFEKTVLEADPDVSPGIWEHVSTLIGEAGARFGGDHDLPLQLITRRDHKEEFESCLGATVDDDLYSGEGWIIKF
jgi:hypothetical protein